MTRKDYIVLAAALRSFAPKPTDSEYRIQHNSDCIAVASALAADNPRFDRAKFLTACGVQITE